MVRPRTTLWWEPRRAHQRPSSLARRETRRAGASPVISTPLEALAEALIECRKYASGAESPPEVVLWCDPGNEFSPILPALRAQLPNLLTLGGYDCVTKTGPALWLRAAAGRQVPEVTWPEDEPAIVYLPGQSRDVLRGAEDCPAELAPLVWFAVAGTFFGQPKQARD